MYDISVHTLYCRMQIGGIQHRVKIKEIGQSSKTFQKCKDSECHTTVANSQLGNKSHEKNMTRQMDSKHKENWGQKYIYIR